MTTPNPRPKLGATLFLALAAAAPLAAQDVLVKAGRIVLAPDATLTDSALLVRAGKIAYVGNDIPDETRATARVVDYGKATVSPGFVLAVTTLGRDADLAEGAFAFTPDLRTAEVFDPWQDELALLAPAGVTSFGLSPSPRNVAGGIGALAKPGKDRGRVAVEELFVGFSLNRTARNPERPPTSLMGARQLLRETFERARLGVEVGPDLAVLRQVLSGQRRALIFADTYAELNAAIALGKAHQFAPVIVGAREAGKVLNKLADGASGVVLGPLDARMRLADLQLPAKLAGAGVPFCFAGRPDQLRTSAALAVRYGLDRTAALAALTRTPATLLGQEARIGSLRQGCSADFVVFEGDLLDLTSRHVATWVDGAPVYAARTTHGDRR